MRPFSLTISLAVLAAVAATVAACSTTDGRATTGAQATADRCIQAPIVATRPIDRQTVVVEGTSGSALLHMTTACITDRDAQIVISVRGAGDRLCDRTDADVTSVVSSLPAACQIASVEPLTVAQGYTYKTKAIDRKSW